MSLGDNAAMNIRIGAAAMVGKADEAVNAKDRVVGRMRTESAADELAHGRARSRLLTAVGAGLDAYIKMKNKELQASEFALRNSQESHELERKKALKAEEDARSRGGSEHYVEAERPDSSDDVTETAKRNTKRTAARNMQEQAYAQNDGVNIGHMTAINQLFAVPDMQAKPDSAVPVEAIDAEAVAGIHEQAALTDGGHGGASFEMGD